MIDYFGVAKTQDMRYLKQILLLTLVLFLMEVNAQLYSIESFQNEYVELEEYHSIAIEEKGYFYWNKRFDLDFQFPFYGFMYDYIICDYSAVCDFDNAVGQSYPIYLLAFGYEWDNVLDTVNIESDVRYALVTEEDVKGLVVQYTRVRLSSDPALEEFDSYINFQIVFFESGDLEIRFGDYNLANSPSYVPGEGFYLYLTNNPPVLGGPSVGLTNPIDNNDKFGMSGTAEDYQEVNDIGILRVLPPEGWVIRFRRNPDATRNLNAQSVRIYPNPAQTEVTIDSDQIFERMDVFDTQGRYCKSIQGANHIDISDLISGMYVVKAFSAGEILTGRFIKL